MKRTALLFCAALLTALWAAPARATDGELAELRYQIEDLRSALDDHQATDANRVNLNGYFDFEYTTDSNPASNSHFRQHHLSLFVTRNWDHWRVYSEVEFEDGTAFGGDGTSANTAGRGQVKLENAWLEYLYNNHLNLRMGKILTPQYWNVNHFPHSVLTTTRPLVVRNVFPVDFTGVMLRGSHFIPSQLGVSYKVYVSNGESANESGADDNENKAVGGRLQAHLGDVIPGFSRFDIGASHYSEQTVAMGAYDVTGADAQMTYGPFELLFEFATHQQMSHEGMYVQPSVWVSPTVQVVYRYDYFNDGLGNADSKHTRHTAGADWRPRPNLSFKASVDTNSYSDSAAQSFESLHLSVAVYF